MCAAYEEALAREAAEAAAGNPPLPPFPQAEEGGRDQRSVVAAGMPGGLEFWEPDAALSSGGGGGGGGGGIGMSLGYGVGGGGRGIGRGIGGGRVREVRRAATVYADVDTIPDLDDGDGIEEIEVSEWVRAEVSGSGRR